MKRAIQLTMFLWYAIVFSQQQQPFHDTQGKLEITNSGQATYTLPIAMPPSLKNTGPVINLVYQSGQFGGIAGQGWNISSISAITRVSNRTDIDGSRQGLHFDSTDKLALDGQRLLVVSGEYWHIGSVYQTETQSNLKIELQRSGFGLYFIVTTPDGSRSWYGNYNNSSTDLSAFYIRRYEDPLGNFITYRYTKPFAKSLCLSEIRFSGNTDALNPLNSIQFHYKKAQRTESAYARGQKLEKEALLSYIEVKTNNQLFRKYEFTHIADPKLGYEKVSQIQEFNGALEPANPVTFEYQNTQTLGLGSELLTTYHNNLDFDSIVLSGDFDGDGRLDFTTENQIFTNNFLGTTGQTPVNSPIVFDKQDTFTATTLAVNKLNPFQSIVKFSEGEGFKVYNLQNGNLNLSYTKRFDFPIHLSCFNPIESCTSTKNAFLEGDFNGDGISEVLLYKICKVGEKRKYTEYECGQFYWVDLNPTISSQLTGNSLSAGPTPGAVILSNPDLLIGKKRYVGDFNGDGKSDIFIINANGTYKVVGFKQLTATPWVEPELLGKGTLSTYSETKQILFGDFNGDGKTDVMLPRASGKYNEANDWWDIYYSNPKPDHTSFFTMETFRIVDYWQHSGMHFKDGIQYSNYYALDTNGDGKSDLVRIWRNKYAPKWTINDYNTNWKITSFVNNIGKTGASGFTLDYETPCQGKFYISCDHHSDSPDMVIPIVSTYRQGINKEILMVRNHYNQVTYVNFTKDVAKDNLLKKVTTANGALIHEINYQPLEPSENNSGYGNPDEFYSSSNSVRYPNIEIKRLPFFWAVSRLTRTTGEVTRHQDFRYHGYTVNMTGLGALGFTKTARSSWYQKPSNSRIWNVMQNDPTKRGLLINTYTQLQRSGAAFSFASGSNIPENVISSMTNQYAITTNNKVYTPLLTRQTTTDHLTSVKSVKDYQYQPVFYLPEIVRTRHFSGSTLQGETTTETEYQNNPNGVGNSYYIGRPIKTITRTNAYDDSQSTETLYTYNSNGTLLTLRKKPLVESYYLTEAFEYDPYGNILKKTLSTPGSEIPTSPRVTEYTYDPSGRFVIASKAITGQTTQYTYHPLYGTVLTQTNPDQLTTTTRYDNWGKPVQVTNYLGKSTYYTYTKNQQTYISQQLDADGGSTISQSNVLGQELKKGIKLSDGQWSYTAIQYDFLGRKVKESNPFVDTPSLWTSYTYDDYNHLVETILPTGKTNRISYSGLTVTTSDGNKTSSTTQNANGHIMSATDNGGTVTYKYNAGGAVTESDFQGTTITTQYDNWGRKSRLSDPSAGEYRYTYYPFGEVRTTTTPLGILKNFIDDFGRLTLTEEEPKNGTSFYSRYYYNTDHTLNSTIREEYTTGKVTDQILYEHDHYK
uniref:FG-GAP-like repeat-containing protein n=1 Tax=Flavobacterium sp. TaxID=239 RepID=UPI0026118A69